MDCSELSKKKFLKVWFACCGLWLLIACGEVPDERSIAEDKSPYEISEYPYDGKTKMDKVKLPVPDISETIEVAPFQKHHEIDFPMHWMHFDRPLMLYIDDPPELNDSLFVH